MVNDETTVLSAMRTMEEGYGFTSGETLKNRDKNGLGSMNKINVTMKNPAILLKTLSVLLIVCGAGLATIYLVRSKNIEATKLQSLTMAQETGDFFCEWLWPISFESPHLYASSSLSLPFAFDNSE